MKLSHILATVTVMAAVLHLVTEGESTVYWARLLRRT